MTGSPSELAEQLVFELSVSDLERSLAFYSSFGFTIERRDGLFAVVRWDDRRLFFYQLPELAPLSGPSRANVRIMVPDVDRLWAIASTLDCVVERSIADRYYGLRDFTVRDPDGLGLRFGSRLPAGTTAPAG